MTCRWLKLKLSDALAGQAADRADPQGQTLCVLVCQTEIALDLCVKLLCKIDGLTIKIVVEDLFKIGA